MKFNAAILLLLGVVEASVSSDDRRKPSISNTFWGIDSDLACSATKEIAGAITFEFANLLRQNKGLQPGSRKTELALEALNKACEGKRWEGFALIGKPGSRTYGDFNKMMNGGGTLDNLSMGPDVKDQLIKACEDIVENFGSELADGMGSSEGVYGYKIKKVLVKDMVKTCLRKPKKEL